MHGCESDGLVSEISNTLLFLSPGDHACPEDDLPRAVLRVRRLQEAHQKPGLLHGRGRALLRER